MRFWICWIMGLAALPAVAAVAFAGENWHGWRGPRGDGTSLEKGIATSWDGTTGENVLWKTEIPGTGHASPITWDDRLFLVTCLEEQKKRLLLCYDKKTGEKLWERLVIQAPLETRNPLNSYASSTPVTDGKAIFVTFLEVDGETTVPARNVSRPRPVTLGKVVVAAYDLAGKRLWIKRPGEFASVHGFCSSPILYKGMVIVNGDHDGDGYIVALEKDSGETRWKVPRAHKTRSYVTPIIRRIGGRTQMVLSGSRTVTSYDPNNGNVHWVIDGPTEQFVASLVYNGSLLFLTGGFPERHILAIRPDGEGNVTDSHVVWRTHRGAGYVPSPIVLGKYFLVVTDRGIGSCFDAASGKRHWMERLAGGHSASPVAAGGLVYFLSDRGVTSVVRPSDEFALVARNELGERCSASPAISGGRLYIRGERNLYAIAESAAESTPGTTGDAGD